MPALMLPIIRSFDPEADVARLSVYTKLRGYVAVAAFAPVQSGVGRATVDGVELSRWECVTVKGVRLLLIPVGDVVHEHGRRCRVVLEGFMTPSGRRFPRCAFWARTEVRRQPNPEHAQRDEAALNAAREGLVLLKNGNGTLPLKSDATLNCLGRGQHRWRLSTAGSASVNPRWRPGFHRAVLEHSGFTVNAELSDFYRQSHADVPEDAVLERAREMCGTALVFIERASGEMIDNRPVPGEYYLTDGELAMLRAARAHFDRLVVILNTGYPIGMAWMQQIAPDAVVWAGFGGMLSAWALVELLDGRLNPSGHLPDTWAWDIADDPVSRNYPVPAPGDGYIQEDSIGVRVYYEEDVYLGYRFFDTFRAPVAFPFGHGLSYTRFEFTPIGLKKAADGVSLKLRIRNAGKVAGKCVAQFYVDLPEGKLEKPVRMLADFAKTALLAPGEAQELTLLARFEDIASFDEAQSAWIIEPGAYGFSAGESLACRIPCGSLRLDGRTLREVRRVCAPMEDFKRLTRLDPTVDGTKSKVVPLGQQIAMPAPRVYPDAPVHARPSRRVLWPQVAQDPSLLPDFASQLSLWAQCRLTVCAGMRLLPWQDGAAGYTPRMRRYGLPSFAVSDAGAGLNLRRPATGFPSSSVVAASFNREIARSVGRVIAEECREQGIQMLLGPGMNLHRSPLCGRHPEYFSEDPLLAGTLAGWQAKGLHEGGALCCYKHLFCNNAELGRLGSHSVASRQALRELYFKVFEIAFRTEQPDGVMTSYNALNGLYPAENGALIHGLVRGEWGFKGVVMSDWGSYRTVSATEMAKAGNDWLTPGGPLWAFRLWRAARRGEISRAELERNARELLRGLGGLKDDGAAASRPKEPLVRTSS